jgi:hypothetical protein
VVDADVLDAPLYQVEDLRFRVPIQLFGDSETFRAMLETATTNDPDAAQAIHLDGISKDEFLFFVRYMNRRCVIPHSPLTPIFIPHEGD